MFYGVGLLYLLYRKNTHFFTAGLIEEVPTIVLSWARLRHTKELNWNFALLYFLLRILYHVVATFEVLEHSMSSFCIGLIILRQHLWWLGIWWRRSSANAHSAGPQLNRFKNNNSQLKLHTKLFICATMVFISSVPMTVTLLRTMTSLGKKLHRYVVKIVEIAGHVLLRMDKLFTCYRVCKYLIQPLFTGLL